MAVEYIGVVATATSTKWDIYEHDGKGGIKTLLFSNEISFLNHYGDDNWTLREKEILESKIEINKQKQIRYIFSRPKV